MEDKIVLPADVYDTLELAALANGGIGRIQWWKAAAGGLRDDPNCPVCVNGLAVFAGLTKLNDPVACPSDAIGIYMCDNDNAVKCINERKGADRNAFVSFEEYVKQLNIVRGS